MNSNLIFDGLAVVPTTGLLGQLTAWNGDAIAGALTRAADPTGLYVVQVGGNDMRDFRSGAPGAPTPIEAAANVVNAVGLLAQAGARNFLVSNLPDLGLTPEAAFLGVAPESTAASLSFNAALAAGLGLLDAQVLADFGVDLDIKALDLFGLSQAVHEDAVVNGGATFGITNVTTPCIAPVGDLFFAPGAVDINCAVSAFSDALHPSAWQGELIAALVVNAVGQEVAAVPEPGTALLLAGGGWCCWRGGG